MGGESEGTCRARLCAAFADCSDRDRELRFMALLTFAAAVFCIVVQLSGVHSSVIEGYFPYADAMFNGVFPYTDSVFVYGYYNVWEYPPLAYVFLLIPRLFAGDPCGYHIVYVALMLLVVWIGMREVGRIARILGKSHFLMVSSYFLLTLVFLEFVLDRFDMLVVVLCLVAVRLFLQERYCGVSAVLALGTLVKLYPVILVPVFAAYLVSERRWGVLGRAIVSFAAVLALSVPFILIGDLTQMIGYHGNRPLEIECFAASLLNVVACIFPGAGMSWEFSYGSDNIVGGVADVLGGIAEPLMFVILIASYFVFWHIFEKRKGAGKCAVMYACLFSVCCFILLGSVFSGQYVLWLVPFVIVLAAYGCGERMFGSRILKLCMWVMVLTQLDFLVNFGLRPGGGALNLFGALVILVRNIFVLWMMAEAFRDIVDADGLRGIRSDNSEPVSGLSD